MLLCDVEPWTIKRTLGIFPLQQQEQTFLINRKSVVNQGINRLVSRLLFIFLSLIQVNNNYYEYLT